MFELSWPATQRQMANHVPAPEAVSRSCGPAGFMMFYAMKPKLLARFSLASQPVVYLDSLRIGSMAAGLEANEPDLHANAQITP